MIFLLLMLFGFAVIVTMIGFFLTTLAHVHNRRSENTLARKGYRIVECEPLHGERIVEPVASRGRRYVDSKLASKRSVVKDISAGSGRLRLGNGTRIARYTPVSALWGRFGRHQRGAPVHWSILTIGLVSIFILGLYTFTFVLPHHALINLLMLNQSVSTNPTVKQQPTYHVSKDLVRIGQLDPGQYNSKQEYDLWAFSTCSAAAMTEVINAYGHHYRVTDILKVEAQIGEITPQLGLLKDIGIQRTTTHFGFKTVWGYDLSLDRVIAIANQGTPVIVSFPPSRYPHGHLVVVTGGDGNFVRIADSSIFDRNTLTRAQFLTWWGGFSAVVTPN